MTHDTTNIIAFQMTRLDLVRAADEVEVVAPQELRDDVLAECEAHAAVVLAPARDVLVRV